MIELQPGAERIEVAAPPSEDMPARISFYRKFLSIATIFSAHVVVIVAIVLALISGHHAGT